MRDSAPPSPPPQPSPLKGEGALHPSVDLRHIETWVFDLDNTLYPASIGLFTQVEARMKAFMAEQLGLAIDDVAGLRRRYIAEYGTTLRGLMSEHGVRPKDYLAYVHDIDFAPLAPAPELGAAIGSLRGRRLIFTNGSVNYAGKILDRLGIAHHFEAIFDIEAAEWRPKPDPATYDRFLIRHGVSPRAAVMFEDTARNLEPAASLGMTTVWVPSGRPWSRDGLEPHIHHVADDLAAWLGAARCR